MTGAFYLYRDSTGEEIPATLKECEGYELAAVWGPEHVVERLNNHFAGHPYQWADSLKE